MNDPINDDRNDGTGADLSVPALATSYDGLRDQDALRAYRLLGLHPGPDVDLDLAAALLDRDPTQTQRSLTTLTDARLLIEKPPGRYRYHESARRHARDASTRIDSAAVRAAAVGRLTSRLLRVATTAQHTINPGRWYLSPHFAQPATGPTAATFSDPVAALDWLETEADNLTAAQQHAHEHGDHASAWQIAEAMWGLFVHRKHYPIFQQAHQVGLAAAQADGDLRAQARMLEGLASYHNNTGAFPDAAACARQALDLERQAGHRIGEASALDMLGVAHLAQGHLDLATGVFIQARDIHQQIRHPRGAALMTRHLGETAARQGRHNDAIDHYTQAIDYFAAHHEHYLHARALHHRAATHLDLGNLNDADTDLHQALHLARRVDAPHETAGIHTTLARLAETRDHPDSRLDHLRRAHQLYRSLNAPQTAQIAEQLAQQAPAADPGDEPPADEPR